MSTWIWYGHPPDGLCAYREVIGFMSTRISYQCPARVWSGQAYCSDHAKIMKQRQPRTAVQHWP